MAAPFGLPSDVEVNAALNKLEHVVREVAALPSPKSVNEAKEYDAKKAQLGVQAVDAGFVVLRSIVMSLHAIATMTARR